MSDTNYDSMLKSDKMVTNEFFSTRDRLVYYCKNFIESHMSELRTVYPNLTSNDIIKIGLNDSIKKVTDEHIGPILYVWENNIDIVRNLYDKHSEFFREGYMYQFNMIVDDINFESFNLSSNIEEICDKSSMYGNYCTKIVDLVNFDCTITDGDDIIAPNTILSAYNATLYCEIIIDFCMQTVYNPLKFINNHCSLQVANCAMNTLVNGIINSSPIGVYNTEGGEHEIYNKCCIAGWRQKKQRMNLINFTNVAPYIYLRNINK